MRLARKERIYYCATDGGHLFCEVLINGVCYLSECNVIVSILFKILKYFTYL